MNWQLVGVAVPLGIAIIGSVYHQGRLAERLYRLRVEHDELSKYAHSISHDTITHINQDISRMKLFLAKHIKNGIDEL
jgi:hypothetical protein